MNSKDGQVYSVCILHAIVWKDDIEFVSEFSCLLGHPVRIRIDSLKYEKSSKLGCMDLWIRNKYPGPSLIWEG